MALILPRRSKLVYPAGAALGFNPKHPAARSAFVISIAANNKNYVDVKTGRSLTINRGPFNFTIDSALGPVPVVSGTSLVGSSADLAATAPAGNTTQACFFRVNATAVASQSLVCGSTAVDTNANLLISNTTLGMWFGSHLYDSLLTVTANEPYFCASSTLESIGASFVLVNLRTGVLKTAAAATSVHVCTAGSGAIRLCDSYNSNQGVTGQVGHAMHSSVNLSMAQLMAWGADPWEFWYPTRRPMLAGAAGVDTTHAAFSVPQVDGRTITQMLGY